MSIDEGAGDAPYWKLDSPEILSDDAQDLTRVGSKVGSFHKYMTSGSARKRQVKEKNCNFCIEELEGDTLDNHLKLSEWCRMLYSRKLRVKTNDDVDPIMIRLYSCINCQLTKCIILSK